MANHPIPLETVAVSVTEDALEAFEAALANACDTVGFFRDHDTGIWRVEGVKQVGVNEAELASSLAVAAVMTGESPVLERSATEADGWLARTYASFPEQLIGERFAVRGTHLTGPRDAEPDHADAGCRAGVRDRRARVHARLPGGAGNRGAPAARADSGYGHRVGHSGDGGGAAAEPQRCWRPISSLGRSAWRRKTPNSMAWRIW